MFQKIRSLLSDSVIYGLGGFISRGINFMLLPLLTNSMAPSEFGKLGVIQTFIGIAEVFFMCGIRQAIMRYRVKDETSRDAAFTAGVAWIVAASIFWFFVLKLSAGFLLGVMGLDAPGAYGYMLAILVFDALTVAPYTLLQSDKRPLSFIIMKIVHVTIHFSTCFYLIYLRHNTTVVSVLQANTLASCLVVGVFIPLYAKNLRRSAPGSLMKRMIGFGLPYIPNVVFVIIIDLIDRILVNRMLGAEQVGLYSAAAKLGVIMFLVVYAFQTAWTPFFLTHMKDESGARMFSRVFTYYVFVTTLVFLTVGLFYREIAGLGFRNFTLVGAKYAAGLPVIPVLLLAYLFCGIYSNFIVGIYAREKTRYIPLITCAGAIINVGCNLFAIPRFGIMGAAIVTLISYMAMAAILYPISMKLYFIPYEWRRIATLALLTALVYVPALVLGSTLVRIIGVAAFVPLLYAVRFFDKEEIAKAKAFLTRR